MRRRCAINQRRNIWKSSWTCSGSLARWGCGRGGQSLESRVLRHELREEACNQFRGASTRTEKRKNGLPNLKSRRTQRKSADKAIVPSCRKASNRKDREAPPHRAQRDANSLNGVNESTNSVEKSRFFQPALRLASE